MNLKLGDRVVDQEGDVGVVTRQHGNTGLLGPSWWVLWETGDDAGQELYIDESCLVLEGIKMNLKSSDRVIYRETGDVGVVLRRTEDPNDGWWVLWETGDDAGRELHIKEESLTLEGTEDPPAEARLKALRPVLDEIRRRGWRNYGGEFTVTIDREMWELIKGHV